MLEQSASPDTAKYSEVTKYVDKLELIRQLLIRFVFYNTCK